MTSQRTVKKNLIGQEDILYGEGSVTQARGQGTYTISKVRNIQPVNSIAELNALDTDKFTKARLYDGVSYTDFAFNGTAWVVVESYSRYSMRQFTAAAGDGVSNDTAAFALAEQTVTGVDIDLNGLTYLVDSIPTGNEYYNGSFVVSGVHTTQSKQPRTHIFDYAGFSNRIVDATPNVYRGLNVSQFPINNGDVVYAWREAPGHGNENPGTEIQVDTTNDNGFSFKRGTGPGNSKAVHTLAFRQADVDTRNTAYTTMVGRLGIIGARVFPDDSHDSPVFVFSDDNGATWDSINLNNFNLSTTWNFHGKIIPWPSSAGGADSGGYIAFFYKSNGTGIGAATTVNNGTTWQEVEDLVVPASGFSSVSENSVTRIGKSNRWVMAIRTGGNMAISTSTDLINWTQIQDSGVYLGSNPPHIEYDSGRLHFIAFSRQDKPIVSAYENAMLVSVANAETAWSAAGQDVFKPWQLVSSLPFFPTGYIAPEKIGNKWYGLYTVENYAGSTQSNSAQLALIGPDSALPVAFGGQGDNLLLGGTLREWGGGTTTITGTSRAQVLPGFTFARAGGAGGWTVTRQVGNKSLYSMRVRRDDADTSTAEMFLVANIPMSVSKPLANQQAAISFRARKASGYSSIDGFLKVQLRQTNEITEQAITSEGGLFAVGDAPVGTSSSGITLTENWQTFELLPGRIAADTTQLSLRLGWVPTGTAANDYIELEMIKLEQNARSTPFSFGNVYEEFYSASRFSQVFTVIIPANSAVFFLYPQGVMYSTPDITLSAGTVVGSPSTSGLRINNATGGNLTVTVTAKVIF